MKGRKNWRMSLFFFKNIETEIYKNESIELNLWAWFEIPYMGVLLDEELKKLSQLFYSWSFHWKWSILLYWIMSTYM